MTTIQQVHWEREVDYVGHPYYVSGNAILHAIAHRLPGDVPEGLQASHGFFVPGQFGTFPEGHSQTGARPSLGANLPTVETYDDLFLFRHPAHPWLLDSRSRDALNAHDVRIQSGHPALAHKTIEGQPDDAKKNHRTTRWYVHAFLHAGTTQSDADVLPIDEDILDGLQFGGKRNYGYGETRLKGTQVVDLEALDYGRIANADALAIELVSPYVLDTTYPGADDRSVPWWWNASRESLRQREENLLAGDEVHRLRTIDHGQVFAYAGDRPIETARNGIRRVGTHAKYGFGEFRVRPIDDDEPFTEDIEFAIKSCRAPGS